MIAQDAFACWSIIEEKLENETRYEVDRLRKAIEFYRQAVVEKGVSC